MQHSPSVHGYILQAAVSTVEPLSSVQLVPLFTGLGLSQRRSRTFVPPPQDAVHCDQGDQLLQPPFTKRFSFEYIEITL
jgi:hypothetical protein